MDNFLNTPASLSSILSIEDYNQTSNYTDNNYQTRFTWPTYECYHKVPDVATCLLVVFDLLLSVISILGNLLVIIAVLRFDQLKTVTNIFVVSLAAADLLVGINVPYYVIFYFDTVLACYRIGCLLRYWATIFTSGCSLMCLVGVSIDRYIAILHPLSYPQLVRRKHAIVFVIVVWIYNGVLSILPVIGIGDNFNRKDECDLYFSHSIFYVLLVVSLHVFLCTLITIVLYSFIFREAWKQSRNVAAMDPNGHVRKETKTARTMALVLGVCLLGYVPYFLIITLRYIDSMPQAELSYIKRFIVALYFGKSAFNPFVYGWKNTDFREAFDKQLRPTRPGLSFIA